MIINGDMTKWQALLALGTVEEALTEAQAELDDLKDRLNGFIEGQTAATRRFMDDYEKAGEGVSTRMSGESAALLVQERDVLLQNLKGLVT